MESGLGCNTRLTATEKKLTFQEIVRDVIGSEDEESDALYMDIHENIFDRIDIPVEEDVEPVPVIMTPSTIEEVLNESGLNEEQTAEIKKHYEEAFSPEDLPTADYLAAQKLVEANAKRKDRLELIGQVENLKQQLEATRALPVTEGDDEDDVPAVKTYDVILRVKPEKAAQIHSEMINGQKCLVIPMGEDEHAAINGVNTTI